jgi:hypothetical protein
MFRGTSKLLFSLLLRRLSIPFTPAFVDILVLLLALLGAVSSILARAHHSQLFGAFTAFTSR